MLYEAIRLRGQDVLRGIVVGCGSVAHLSHLPAFRVLKGVEIAAVCDQKENIAVGTARRWGIRRAYGDFSRMLTEENLDFVDLCSPPQTHFPFSVQAMEAGLHVLMEKPMALSVSEADEMLSVSRNNNVKLCVVHNFLFSRVAQKAKSLVDAGAIGDLVAVEVEILDRREGVLSKQDHWCHSLPGGIFGEYAPHAVYLLSELLGKIDLVRAITAKYGNYPWVRADELKVLLEAENGLGAFTISCNSPRTSFTMDIFGTKRSLHIDNLAMTMIQHKSGVNRIRDLALNDLKSALQLAIGAASSSLGALFGRRWYKIGHRAIIEGFIESMRNNMDPPVTGEDGRETLRILEDIWKQVDRLNSVPGRYKE
jgi:predicted dehydrogenase